MKEGDTPKRFVVDVMLGRLAKWLRVLGFDTVCERLTDREQIDVFRQSGYIPITRNQHWRGRADIFLPTANDPAEQLREVISGIPILLHEVRPLRRCIRCNERLQPVSRDSVQGSVPDYVFEMNTLFRRCPRCDKTYWPGSHQKRMMERLHGLFGKSVPEATHEEEGKR